MHEPSLPSESDELPAHAEAPQTAAGPETLASAVQTAELAAPADLGALFPDLPVGLVIAEAPSGRILECNAEGRRLLAIAPPFVAPVAEDGDPAAALGPWDWPLTRAIRTGEVVEGEEIELLGADGQQRVFRVSAAPVRAADGRITLGAATILDVTEARRRLDRERLLRVVSDLLSTSLDYRATVQRLAELCVRSLAQYCLVHIEHNGEIRALGVASSGPLSEEDAREFLRRFPVDPLGNHPVAEALRSGESQLLAEVGGEQLGAEAPDPERHRLLREADLASALVVPIRAPGRTLGAITLARTTSAPRYRPEDVELVEALAVRAAHAVDNARLYRESQQASRARDELMSVVSHDLRNSLHAALLNVDLVLDVSPAFGPESPHWRRMAAVRRSLQHMHRLVQDLLEVDRIGRGRLAVHPERLEPLRVATEIEEIFGPLARESGVRLEVRVAENVPPMQADPARLIQVLSNLISNALHATPAEGRIEVAIEPEGTEWVRLRVTDTGAGMSEPELAQVFDRFFQGASGRRTGVGLGLSIVRGIVEAHGGRVWAESRPGTGSTFSLTLPRAGGTAAGSG